LRRLRTSTDQTQQASRRTQCGQVPAGWSALSLRRIDASARVTLRHANRAAVSEKSVGTPTFALTGASAAAVAAAIGQTVGAVAGTAPYGQAFPDQHRRRRRVQLRPKPPQHASEPRPRCCSARPIRPCAAQRTSPVAKAEPSPRVKPVGWRPTAAHRKAARTRTDPADGEPLPVHSFRTLLGVTPIA
jgi:hypothetical protein